MPDFQVLTKIRLNLLHPNEMVVVHAKQFDSIARIIEADLVSGSEVWTLPSGVTGIIGYAKPDGTIGLYDALEDNTPAVDVSEAGKVKITLVDQILTCAGNTIVDVKFFSGDARLTTFSFILQVEKSTPNDDELVSHDYFNVLSRIIEGLVGATTHPPQIDPTSKNWLLWSEEDAQYVDSGFSSVGTKGNKGDKGDPGTNGTSIQNVTKRSGTGAPGTSDVYNVNLDDGTVAGTFSVYNGNDGQGSPGSQLPLEDGIATAGSAVAYSREDHVHPIHHEVPSGGTVNQVLKKSSNADYALAWGDASTGSGVHIGDEAPTDPNIDVWIDPDGEETMQGIPAGGTAGQFLKKQSATSYDVGWYDVPHELPAGGTIGQVLKKTSADDYATGWGNLPAISVVSQTVNVPQISAKGYTIITVDDPPSGTIGWFLETSDYAHQVSLGHKAGQNYAINVFNGYSDTSGAATATVHWLVLS